MRGHRGGPQARFEGLDVERILDAAMDIVDEDGIEALSMRRLGKALNADPMAVYYYLPNKQAIIAGLVQRVFGEIEVALEIPTEASWQDQVRIWGRTYRSVAGRHHHLIIHLISNASTAGEQVMRVNEALYAALASSEMAPVDIVRGADTIVDYIHGVILGEHHAQTEADDWHEMFSERIDAAEPDELQAMRTVFGSLDHGEYSVDPDFGLEVIIAGMERVAQLEESA